MTRPDSKSSPTNEPALPACIRVSDGAVTLSVKAQPRAPKNELAGMQGDALRIKIAAPPVDSAANEALVEFLAECLGCPRNRVELLRGGTSRHKLFRISGIATADIIRRLGLDKAG
ncbi:MAG TPA: DUF167 domain-containing protein [Roseimicrobium sp.]|nr:DUF167 domain-containing protein [Roseimicrobium sp.]